MQAERTDSNVPVNLQVDKGGGVTGLTAVVAVRDGASQTSYLDFDDDTFKAGGWVTRQAAMADLGDGIYSLAGGLDVSAITNLPAATRNLILEFDVSGAEDGNAIDQITLIKGLHDSWGVDVSGYASPSVGNLLANLVTSIWDKDVSALVAPAVGRTINRIRVYLTNRTGIDIANQRLVVYEDDGVTPAQRWGLLTDAGPPDLVIAPAGSVAHRSDPLDPL